MRLHNIVAGILLLLGLSGGVSAAAPDARNTLDIYFLDMMGGASTLIVTPLGQSVLIDTGSSRCTATPIASSRPPSTPG